ncbi:MAG TPA: hypothetical protein VNX46_09945, partial [Candidatus Acidoferrum sp.]|nr:hypothetical protein [Candidatus Acidoferrum sp.]
QKKAPKDFDNTAIIELMRRAMFKDVDALLASGLVDELLVTVLNKPKADGSQVQNYVPPPLGTGLWSKPAPSSVPGPGVLPTPAAAASGIPSAIAQRATAEAPAASHPADVMARINAFLEAYAKKEAADSSGIPSGIALATTEAQQAVTEALAASNPGTTAAAPAAVAETPAITATPMASAASLHPSGHPPTAQPSPLWGEGDRRSDEVRPNSPLSQQPAKPSPTPAGTAPAINPSG